MDGPHDKWSEISRHPWSEGHPEASSPQSVPGPVTMIRAADPPAGITAEGTAVEATGPFLADIWASGPGLETINGTFRYTLPVTRTAGVSKGETSSARVFLST
jgi:hypothetical protein